MRVSLNAVREIYKQAGVVDFLPKDINKITEKIGAQLGEIEEITDLGKIYGSVVVVKVVSCIDHPNADKLKVCKIDTGNDTVQVVCGAPNVTEGMLAAWLPPGSTVPATSDKEPLVLEARKIRGEISNGMLASASELGVSDDHSGIIEIDKKAEPGDSFAKLYKLDDYLIDIENKMFTHRPDCFGLMGIARELAGIYHKPFKSPGWYEEKPGPLSAEVDKELKLEVINEIPELTKRFCAVVLQDVKVGPSPLWLQIALFKAGIKAINNVVDLTNFYMYYSGQPLHAYDYDKVAELSSGEATIKVRKTKNGEKLKLINGKEVAATEKDILIATDKHPIGIGGVIGGADTEVDDSTRNIILECADFDANSIRKTSMAHGIFTDAVTRFTKGQSPRQNLAVLTKIAKDIMMFTDAKAASKTFDEKSRTATIKPTKASAGFINDRLGLSLDAGKIKHILENVEFKVTNNGQNLEITPPFWRTDIEIPEDIVEEVGRLYGYDNLPLRLPEKAMAPSRASEELGLRQRTRKSLAALGANEILTYSFINGDLLEIAGQDKAKSYKIKNALSPELQYYRQGLLPSLLEKVHPNIKAGFDDFALFELGKVHSKDKQTEGLPDESSRLALVVASKKKPDKPAFYTARKYLLDLLSSLNIAEDSVSFEQIKPKSYFQSGRVASIVVDGNTIGHIGEYNQKITKGLKLPGFCAGFEVYLEYLDQLGSTSSYKAISRYPSIEQDICLKTAADVTYAEIKERLQKSLQGNSSEDVSIFVKCIDIFSKEQNSKQTTFRILASSQNRTLNTDTMNKLFESAAMELKESIKADVV